MSFGEEHQKIVRYQLSPLEYTRKESHSARWTNDAKMLAEQGWMITSLTTGESPGIPWSKAGVERSFETVVIYQRHPDWYEWAEKEATKKKAEEQAAKKIEAEFDDTVSDWIDE